MAVVAVLEDLAAARRLLASLRDAPLLETASATQARALVAKLGAGVTFSTGEAAELVSAAQSVHWASADHLRAVESAAVTVATTRAAVSSAGGAFTITHANNAQTDRTVGYLVVGG